MKVRDLAALLDELDPDLELWLDGHPFDRAPLGRLRVGPASRIGGWVSPAQVVWLERDE